MLNGLKDLSKIEKDYTCIDSCIYNGEYWRLYEHDIYGDEIWAIAVNFSKKVYTYTYENLEYTIENIEEYELFKL